MLFHLTHFLLQWMSSHYTQVFLIMKRLSQLKRNMIIIQTRPYLLTLLPLILTLNKFIFNSNFYLLIKGYYSMGTICAPSYPNIFMSEFEEKHIYLQIKNKSVIYLRYIGDTFMVWIKSESELKHFTNEINKKHQPIKFDFKFSKESIEFLGIIVYIDSKKRLQTTFYWLSRLFTSKIDTPVLT